MASDEPNIVDRSMIELRAALGRVRAPSRVEASLLRDVSGSKSTAAEFKPPQRKGWLPVGIAASVGLAVLAFQFLPGGTAPDQREPQSVNVPGHLVSRTHVPFRVHSLSRGTEIWYLETNVIRDEQGITRAVYISLPQGN